LTINILSVTGTGVAWPSAKVHQGDFVDNYLNAMVESHHGKDDSHMLL
jgi:hypothetical protein